MSLDEFFTDNAAKAWGWGVVDCSLALADWAIAKGHPDPALAWRGAYSDELGWKRIVIARGGLLPLVNDACSRAGFTMTETIATGAVGVIGSQHNIERQWGAIYDGAQWMVRDSAGFAPITARPLGMWLL